MNTKLLREKTESFLASAEQAQREKLLLDSRSLIHELQNHHVELETQNQELLRTRGELECVRNALADLYDTAPVGFLTIDENGMIRKANNTFADSVGVGTTAPLDRHLSSFVNATDRDTLHRHLDAAARGMGPKHALLRLDRRDGASYLGELTGLNRPVVKGATRYFNIAISDVTERERARQELDKVQRLESLGLLAGGIAHDFNNLLQAIFGNVELASAGITEGHASKRLLDQAMSAIGKANDLTRQLLTFAKGGTPAKKAVRLPELVREAAAISLSGANVDYALETGEGVTIVDADVDQLSQVLRNLMINARQAMPKGGHIHIGVDSRFIGDDSGLDIDAGRYVTVTIRDEGCGIPPDDIPKVFDPFFTTKSAGTGLGLAVCFSIIKQHHGAIAMHSVVGKGTTFTLYLPEREQGDGATEDSWTPPGDVTGKILVMDDEPALREVTAHMLAWLGFEAETARDGNEAIALFREAAAQGRPFDAVILDLTVTNGLGGAPAMAEIRKMDPNIVGIVSSGYANSPVLSNPSAHDFDAKLDKPYKKDTLGALLGRLLNRSTAGSEPPRRD